MLYAVFENHSIISRQYLFANGSSISAFLSVAFYITPSQSHYSENLCANRRATNTINTWTANASTSASTAKPASICFSALQFNFKKSKRHNLQNSILSLRCNEMTACNKILGVYVVENLLWSDQFHHI